MREADERIYLDKRRACWVCSRQLQQLQNGPHKGKFVALRRMVGGHEGFLHVFCAETEDVLDFDAAYREEDDEKLAT